LQNNLDVLSAEAPQAAPFFGSSSLSATSSDHHTGDHDTVWWFEEALLWSDEYQHAEAMLAAIGFSAKRREDAFTLINDVAMEPNKTE
jgi:hypothetical protein